MTEAIGITRTFDAPCEAVYDAWITPEHFSRWFGTEAVAVPLDTLDMDVRVGGRWRAVMHLPDGALIDWTGEYLELDRPNRLAFTITDRPDDPERESVVVTLTAVNGATEMTMTQLGSQMSDEQIARTTAGYNGFFDVIEKIVRRR